MGDRQCSAVTFGKWQCKIMKDKIVKEAVGVRIWEWKYIMNKRDKMAAHSILSPTTLVRPSLANTWQLFKMAYDIELIHLECLFVDSA